jgi:hypothetical protein
MHGMPIRVSSCDRRAADLLDVAASWDVVARFERSLILAGNPGGSLISVVRHDIADGPYTVRLDRLAPADMRVFDAPPVLDRASAARWLVEPVRPGDAVGRAELRRRLAILDVVADRAGGRGGGCPAAIPGEDLGALELAFAGDDPAAAGTAAARVAGLGPGLTPSGDDVLAGALATHAWAEAAGILPGGEPLRRAAAAAAATRTTRLGCQLIEAAAAGEVAVPLARVLASLFGRVATFPPDIAPLLAVGATSGSDLLAGVRLAGRALRARLPAEGVA